MPPMTSNGIVKSLDIATVTKAGKQLVLAAATRTDAWKRTDEWARSHKDDLAAAIMAPDCTPLPENTTKVITKDFVHPSDEDPKEHISILCKDKNDNELGMVHIYPPEPKKKSEAEKKSKPEKK